MSDVKPVRCETCRWWGGRVSGRVYDPGPCRRYPPLRMGPSSFEQYRPVMSITDFCGEHQPHTPKDRP